MTQPLYQSVGGTRSFNIYSGGLTTHGSGGKEPLSNPGTGDSVWFSGAGRVNTVIPHGAVSGEVMTLYDSVVTARSGISSLESGIQCVFQMPRNTNGGMNGIFNEGPPIFRVDTPFFSGLAMQARSGVIGVTVYYTPAGSQT